MNQKPARWVTVLISVAALFGASMVLFYPSDSSPPAPNRSGATAVTETLSADVPPAAIDAEVGETDWLQLMPPEDIAALEQMAPIQHYGGDEPGSYGLGSFAASQGLDVFSSFSTVAAMNGKQVKLAGFIVPLTANQSNELVEFFLVPYFGACLHTPPPPPNQIVHVVLPNPIPMTDLWTGYWVEGELRIKLFLNEVGGSAYQIRSAKVVPWS